MDNHNRLYICGMIRILIFCEIDYPLTLEPI